MERNKELANRLQEVLLSGQWIANTNWKAQIESVTWIQATHKTGSLNTIALLTFHVNYYLAGLIRVLKGGKLDIRDKDSFNMPPVASETDWETLKQSFLENASVFVQEVADMPDSKLDAPFVAAGYGTWLRNIEGVIEHSYYHLGQVSLIKKLIL